MEFSPILSRWITNSKTNITAVLKNIISLFTKTFYIESFFVLNREFPIHKFIDILNENLLSSYGLSSLNFPILKLKKTEPYSLEQFCPELPKRHEDELTLINFFLKFIDLSFNIICNEFKISIKSDLKRFLSFKGVKLYEIKMFINLIYNLIQNLIQKSSESAQKNIDFILFVQNGGVVGDFYTYLYTSLIRQFNENLGKKHLIIPKNEYNYPITPKWIINYIDRVALSTYINQNKEYKLPIIADISCSLGLFFEPFLHNIPILNNFGTLRTDTQKKNEDLCNHLFGYDANELFIEILRLNNSFLNLLEKPHINNTNLIAIDTLYFGTGRSFDIIVGCSPIKSRIDFKKIMNLSEIKITPKKVLEPFIIFMIRALLSLNNGGILYVMLPESILFSPNYGFIRKFILEQFSILEIIHFDEKIVLNINSPVVIIGIQRKNPEHNHNMKITLISNSEIIQKLHNNEIDLFELCSDSSNHNNIKCFTQKQTDILSNPEFILDLFSHEEDKSLFRNIPETSIYKLKDLVNSNKGVEIGKNGYIFQCYNCKVWFSQPSWKIDNRTGNKFTQCSVCKTKLYKEKIKNQEQIIDQVAIRDKSKLKELYKNKPFELILLDSHIDNYSINGFSVLKLGYRGVKYNNAEIYKPKKIVLKKTNNRIIAAIDYNGYYTHYTLTQLTQKLDIIDNPFLLEYVLGLITSSFILNYFSKKYQNKKLEDGNPFNQANLLNIPIPKINFFDHNDETYGLFLHIVLYVLVIQILFQFTIQKGIDTSLENTYYTFLKLYNQNLARHEITVQFKEIIGCVPQELLTNIMVIENPLIIVEQAKNKIDILVKKLFRIN